MSKTIMLNSRFWEDNYISELDPIEKLLFIYCLTNPRISISGIYEVPLRNIELDTGIAIKVIEKVFEKFQFNVKIAYREGWVCIIKYPKYQNYRSPLIQKAVRNELAIVPKFLLDYFILIGYPIHTLFIGLKGKGKDKEEDKDKEDKNNFEKFWTEYPRKISKKKAEQVFLKISPDNELFKKIMSTLETAKRLPQWTKDNGQFIPHPTTWLNQERWNDELEVKTKLKSKYEGI